MNKNVFQLLVYFKTKYTELEAHIFELFLAEYSKAQKSTIPTNHQDISSGSNRKAGWPTWISCYKCFYYLVKQEIFMYPRIYREYTQMVQITSITCLCVIKQVSDFVESREESSKYLSMFFYGKNNLYHCKITANYSINSSETEQQVCDMKKRLKSDIRNLLNLQKHFLNISIWLLAQTNVNNEHK